ncbi:internal head protein [Vibrio phage USC-1]|uniref:Uncharacterized protein n=2 Tax=Aphroditevirus USC1 TaxID=2846605 RepID=A0A514A2G5_9CAUD|nr:internal head protein [Vibrio phage USC-1]QCW23251.1 hypothetical protein [Vibrio phage 5 TSL-2019]QDH47477.1 hypothetical protein [Vibrio phage USC-1]
MKGVMAARLRARVAGIESLDMTEEEVVQLVEEVAEKKVDNEVKEISKEVEKLADKVEEEAELVEELEEVVEGMEGLINSGNPNPAALSILYHRAERIHTKLGGTTTMPRSGVENLTTKTLEAHAIVGLESFSDTLKNVGEFGKDLVRRSIQFLIDLWNSIMGSESRIKRQMKELNEKLDKNGVKEKVKLGPWANMYPAYSTLDETKKDQAQLANNLLDMAQTFLDNIEKHITNEGELVSHCSDFQKGIETFYNKETSELTKSGDFTLYRVSLGPGIRYYSGEIKTFGDAKKFLNSIRILPYLTDKVESKEVSSAFTKTDLKRFLNEHVPRHLTNVKNSKTAIKNVERDINQILAKGPKPELQGLLKAYLSALTNIFSGVMRSNQRIIKVDLEMVKVHIA